MGFSIGALSPATARAALTQTVTAPFVPGAPFEVTVEGATPGATVWFFRGGLEGAGPCPAFLGGLCLDIVNPTILGSAVADATGAATLGGALSESAPAAARVPLQAVTGAPSPDKSDVANAYARMRLSAADARLVGDVDGEDAGSAVSDAGDVNGDGFGDVLVGAPGSVGTVYLVHGPLSGDVDLATADARLWEEEGDGDDGVGGAVSGAGDVDADGFDDIVVGAWLDDTTEVNAGAAFLIRGPVSGEVNLSAADAKLLGPSGFEYAGNSVSGAGDVNADGFHDLLIGAYRDESAGDDAGAAYLVHGPVLGEFDLAAYDAKLLGETSDDHAGESVSGAGDVDGDGFADLVVGAHEANSRSGGAYLVLGPVSGVVDLSAADARLIGEAEYDDAGRSVSAAGDVNGDGLDDVLVGAPGESTGEYSAGAAYLLLGSVSGEVPLSASDAKMLGQGRYDAAGGSVSGAGDVDGDGLDDLLVGAHYGGAQLAGVAYLLLGPVTGERDLASADFTYLGELRDGFAGEAVSGAGDVDSDGLADLLIGALAWDYFSTGPGTAYLVYGWSL